MHLGLIVALAVIAAILTAWLAATSILAASKDVYEDFIRNGRG